MKIAVLASGSGTNFQAIVKAQKKGVFKSKVTLLLSDKEKAYARTRAKELGIKDIYVNPKEFSSRESFDKQLVKILRKENIGLVVLAGYMRILSPYFVKAFKNKIINIHPALLPSFKGAHAIDDAYKYGVKVTGVTVHFVDEKVDHGPIILQGVVLIKEKMTKDQLETAIHKLEHKLYPQAIKLFCSGKLSVENRKVKIG